MCVCVSVTVILLTSESLDLENSFLLRRYILKISRSSLYIKVIGIESRSRSQEQKSKFMYRVRRSAGATERQSSYIRNMLRAELI